MGEEEGGREKGKDFSVSIVDTGGQHSSYGRGRNVYKKILHS